MAVQTKAVTGVLSRVTVELGPLLIFFVVARGYGFFVGTAALMAATVAAVSYGWYRDGRVPPLPLVSVALALVLGGMTLWLDDPRFIKVRPTLINVLAAAALFGGLLRDRLVLKSVLGDSLSLQDEAWRVLTRRLVIFLLALAVLNEVTWRSISTQDWVAFKTFGLPLLNLAFILGNWPFVKREME